MRLARRSSASSSTRRRGTFEELLPQLEPRAEELAAVAIQKLAQRGAREEKDLRETLERQRDRVREELAKTRGRV